MLSSAKRLCSSSSLKYQWNPIVDDDYLRLPNLISMIVAQIKDNRLTSDILIFINKIYPWPNSLKHIRRIYKNNDKLDIILYPLTFKNQIEINQYENYFENSTKIIDVPSTPCLLKWQYDICIKQYWPNIIFKQNQILEQNQLNKSLTEQDYFILDLLKKIQENDIENHYAIITDNKENIPLVGCRDYRTEHPLQHCTMIAIDLLSANSIYLKENLIEKFVEKKEKKNYLLNNCSIYLTNEPCIMCSMALLHSRISNIYYINKNIHFGSVGSIYKLHCLKKTNHRFNVYHLQDIQNS